MVKIEVPQGTTELLVSDGVEQHTYKPSRGVVTVEDRHVGAVLGAVPGAVVREEDDQPAATSATSDTRNGA